MPVPSSIDDLSTTAASNSPSGSDSVGAVDDHLRAHAAFIRQIYNSFESAVAGGSLVSSTEVQTATAAQTVFTLSTMIYAPGVGALRVFVDGLLVSDYTETSSNIVTFSSGLSAGQEVTFEIGSFVTSGLDAGAVSVVQSGAGAVGRPLDEAINELCFSPGSFGGALDGTTNDYAAILAAQTAALAVGGTVLIPKTCAFSTPLVLKSGVNWLFGSGAKLKWIGSAGATCVETDSTTVYKNVRWNGMTIDTGSAFTGTALKIHSAHNVSADVITLVTTGTTSKALVLIADSSGGETDLTKRNITAVNIGSIVHQGQCGTLLECSGVAAGYDANPQVITLNTIGAIFGENCALYGLNLINWTDNNCFPGMTRMMINANNGVGLQVSGTNGTLNQGVYANQFGIVAVDTFSTFTGRIGARLGYSKLTQIKGLYQNPVAEGGSLVVDSLTLSYDVTLIRDSDGALVQYRRGEFYASNFGFNSTQGTLLADDTATGIDVTDYGTNENITFMLTVATDDANANGVVWCKVRRSTGSAAISLVAGGANIAVRTGAMTGTTGTDTKLNISTHNDGKFYIENRLGIPVYVSYHIAAKLQTP